MWEDDNINRILTPYFVPCDNQAPSAYATQGGGCNSSTIPFFGILGYYCGYNYFVNIYTRVDFASINFNISLW